MRLLLLRFPFPRRRRRRRRRFMKRRSPADAVSGARLFDGGGEEEGRSTTTNSVGKRDPRPPHSPPGQDLVRLQRMELSIPIWSVALPAAPAILLLHIILKSSMHLNQELHTESIRVFDAVSHKSDFGLSPQPPSLPSSTIHVQWRGRKKGCLGGERTVSNSNLFRVAGCWDRKAVVESHLISIRRCLGKKMRVYCIVSRQFLNQENCRFQFSQAMYRSE